MREVDKELQVEVHDRLLKERDVYIEEHPQFKMVGPDFVVPTPVIDDICSNLRFITTQDGIVIAMTSVQILSVDFLVC